MRGGCREIISIDLIRNKKGPVSSPGLKGIVDLFTLHEFVMWDDPRSRPA